MSLKVFVTALRKDYPPESFSTCGYTVSTFWKNSVLRYGNVQNAGLEACDVICLFATYLAGDYKFDDELARKIIKTKKPIVVFDYSEYGAHSEEHLSQYNLYGYSVEHSGLLAGEYQKIHSFLTEAQLQIKCYFKRELSAKNDLSKIPAKVFPLEFISPYAVYEGAPDSEEQYYNRPCIINFIWGFSNFSRPFLHGELMLRMQHFNCNYALSYNQVLKCLETPSEKFVMLLNIAWFERVDIRDFLGLNPKSYMVVDLYGCGLKCFRNVESTFNCLSIKQNPSKLVWSYPWIDGVNCIYLPTLPDSNILDVKASVDIIEDLLHRKRDSLYPIYLKSLETNRLYDPKNYVPNHIIKHIVENL